MTGASPQDNLPDLPWGKVAGVAAGVAAAWLAVRGVVGIVRIASHEAEYRALDGGWISRRF